MSGLRCSGCGEVGDSSDFMNPDDERYSDLYQCPSCGIVGQDGDFEVVDDFAETESVEDGDEVDLFHPGPGPGWA